MASLRLILGLGLEGLVSAEVSWPPVSWEPSNRSDLRNKSLRIKNTLLQYFSSIFEYTSCILHWDYFYLRTWITINYFWTIWWRSTNYLHIRDRWTYWTAMANSKNLICFLVVYSPSWQVAKTHAAHQRETSEWPGVMVVQVWPRPRLVYKSKVGLHNNQLDVNLHSFHDQVVVA